MQNIENSKYRPPNLKMQNNKNLTKKKAKIKIKKQENVKKTATSKMIKFTK